MICISIFIGKNMGNSMKSNTDKKKHPKVGVGVLVVKENQILLGERINAHGSGTWCPPGGHLEFGESPQDCAARELEEEAGLIAKEVILGPWTNDFFESEGKHYVTLYTLVPEFKGIPFVQEPDKCLRWEWFEYDNLPSPLFLSLSNLINTYSLHELFSANLRN
jgi:8-oxo-dGTP diphosphatase